MTIGATLAGTTGLSMLSGTASAHGLSAFRDAFIGNDTDKTGLGSKGWIFFAKDTGQLYYHDGSSWNDLEVGRTQSYVGVRAYASTDQTISANTRTKINLDSTEFDDGGEFDATNGKIVVNESGRYQIIGNVQYKNTNSGDQIQSLVYKNGSNFFTDKEVGLDGGNPDIRNVGVRELSAGDELELYAYHQSSSSLDTVSGRATVFLTMTRLG